MYSVMYSFSLSLSPFPPSVVHLLPFPFKSPIFLQIQLSHVLIHSYTTPPSAPPSPSPCHFPLPSLPPFKRLQGDLLSLNQQPSITFYLPIHLAVISTQLLPPPSPPPPPPPYQQPEHSQEKSRFVLLLFTIRLTVFFRPLSLQVTPLFTSSLFPVLTEPSSPPTTNQTVKHAWLLEAATQTPIPCLHEKAIATSFHSQFLRFTLAETLSVPKLGHIFLSPSSRNVVNSQPRRGNLNLGVYSICFRQNVILHKLQPKE